MAIDVKPPAINLPSAEPYASAVLAALQDNLPEALDIVAQTYTDPVIDLPAPDSTPDPNGDAYGYSQEVVNSYSVVQSWPFVCVFSGNVSMRDPTQQGAGGRWEAEMFVRMFLQNSDENALTISLSRYMVAIWLVIVNADLQRALKGAEVLYGTEELEPDPSGGVTNERAVEVRFTISFRT